VKDGHHYVYDFEDLKLEALLPVGCVSRLEESKREKLESSKCLNGGKKNLIFRAF